MIRLSPPSNNDSKDFETLAEAKRVQGSLSKAAKAFDGKVTVKREGTVVYVVRRG